MIETLISTMTYGFLGNWMFGLIKTSNGEWTAWPAYAVLLGGSAIAYTLISSFKEKRQYFASLVVLLAYIFILGLIALAAMLLVWIFFKAIASFNNNYDSRKPQTSKQIKQDRKDALDLEVIYSDELLRCLDYQSQLAYKNDLENLIYDETATRKDIERVMSRWDYYRRYPMIGSEKYKQEHRDD